jgi:hypothetical protein
MQASSGQLVGLMLLWKVLLQKTSSLLELDVYQTLVLGSELPEGLIASSSDATLAIHVSDGRIWPLGSIVGLGKSKGNANADRKT